MYTICFPSHLSSCFLLLLFLFLLVLGCSSCAHHFPIQLNYYRTITKPSAFESRQFILGRFCTRIFIYIYIYILKHTHSQTYIYRSIYTQLTYTSSVRSVCVHVRTCVHREYVDGENQVCLYRYVIYACTSRTP